MQLVLLLHSVTEANMFQGAFLYATFIFLAIKRVPTPDEIKTDSLKLKKKLNKRRSVDGKIQK